MASFGEKCQEISVKFCVLAFLRQKNQSNALIMNQKIPQTKVEVIFLGPKHGFSTIYQSHDEKGARVGSVNAGNSNSFYIRGSGGINAAFAAVLSAAGQFPGTIDPYVRIHQDLFDQAQNGSAIKNQFDQDEPLRFALVHRPPVKNATFLGNDGTVFVDIFKPNLVPNNNPANYAMVYAAPPYGPQYPSSTDFLAAVEATARNIIVAVRQYNQYVDNHPNSGLETIENIRQCLYSSGIYRRQNVHSDKVALALYAGLKTELIQDEGAIKSIAFENGPGNQRKGPFDVLRGRL